MIPNWFYSSGKVSCSELSPEAFKSASYQSGLKNTFGLESYSLSNTMSFGIVLPKVVTFKGNFYQLLKYLDFIHNKKFYL